MAKMSITFDGFEKMMVELERQGTQLKPVVDEALTKTQEYIQQNVESAAAPYANGGRKGYANGLMNEAIIKDARIDWSGDLATVKVGFSSDHPIGYMHSIFVMHGVPAHGKFNKGYQKDANLYNAVFGTKTKKEIERIQKEVMEKNMKFGR